MLTTDTNVAAQEMTFDSARTPVSLENFNKEEADARVEKDEGLQTPSAFNGCHLTCQHS